MTMPPPFDIAEPSPQIRIHEIANMLALQWDESLVNAVASLPQAERVGLAVALMGRLGMMAAGYLELAGSKMAEIERFELIAAMLRDWMIGMAEAPET